MLETPIILIATDDPLLSDTIATLLVSTGFQTGLAQTGEEAEAAIGSGKDGNPFDALIVDIALRKCDSLDLTKRLRSKSETRHLPILFLSPYSTRDDDVPSALHAGADDILAIPFRHQELTLKLHRMLERQRWSVERQRMLSNLIRVADGIETVLHPTGEQPLPDLSEGPPPTAMTEEEGQMKWKEVDGALAEAIDALQRTANTEESAILQRALIQLSSALNRASRYVKVRTQAKSLQDTNEQLRELDRLRSEFTNAIVHDIRSPLGTVISTLDLIEVELNSRKPNISEIRQMATGARGISQKLIGLVSELLDFSKLESGNMELKLGEIIVPEIIERVGEDFEIAARKKSITLSYGCDKNLPVLLGDSGKIQRALANLLSNAIKFTPENGQVWFEARSAEGTQVDAGVPYVVFSVVDSGEGIPAQDLPYVFDPYYQASNRNGNLGTGLGLAIVKRIAAAHGGNVAVRSQVGVGSAFSIVLPLSPSQNAIVVPPILSVSSTPVGGTDISEAISNPKP
jgi:signal transduction histidine kinase